MFKYVSTGAKSAPFPFPLSLSVFDGVQGGVCSGISFVRPAALAAHMSGAEGGFVAAAAARQVQQLRGHLRSACKVLAAWLLFAVLR
jgi:hypothetical protein